jgi:hypothetical protein
VEGVFRKSDVVHSFKAIETVLFVFGSHGLYSRDLQLFSFDFTSSFMSTLFSLRGVTIPSAKPPFLEDKFVSPSLASHLAPVKNEVTVRARFLDDYQSSGVPGGGGSNSWKIQRF